MLKKKTSAKNNFMSNEPFNCILPYKKGLSQDELADKIGISKSYLNKIEAPNSTKAYSLDVLFAIADGLEIDVIKFFMLIEE